ncbi:MAG: hypothetical protein Q8K93_18245 [Reyranella sp.]|nr:hypothetical protein [Reyranella sp.]
MMVSSGFREYRRLVLALALPVMAAACAPAGVDQSIFTLGWSKLGIGYESFVNTRNDCVMAASVVTENAAGREQAMPAVSASRFKSCMRSSCELSIGCPSGPGRGS